MHTILKVIIYSAISLFTLVFGFFIVVSIRDEFRSVDLAGQQKVDSVAFDLKCYQDSLAEAINTSITTNASKIDSAFSIVHKVESVSKKADVILENKFKSVLRTIDSLPTEKTP